MLRFVILAVFFLSALAVVEPAPGVTPSPDLERELVAFCRDRLAHYECPRRIEFTEQLPLTDAGKMQRRVLRERYRMETTQ